MTALPRPIEPLCWMEALLSRHAATPELLLFALPAPVASGARLFARFRAGAKVFWQPDAQNTWVGWHVARTLTARGSNRFRVLADLATRQPFQGAAWGDLALPEPWWFGGFSFAPGWAEREPWVEFGDARFFLPRFTYQCSLHQARLVVAVAPEHHRSSEGRRLLLTQTASLLELLARIARPGLQFGGSSDHARDRALEGRRAQAGIAFREKTARPGPTVAGSTGRPCHALGEDDLRSLLTTAWHAVLQSRLTKLVAAHRLTAWLPERPELDAVLLRLREEAPAGKVFAFCFGTHCFLGQSPERLIRMHGLEFESEAVAGTAPASLPQGAELLRTSPKHQHEHELVVNDLRDRLEPLCSRLMIGSPPEVVRFGRMFHLRTRITGRLRNPAHVLELAELLHPSAAVAGLPRAQAVRWIAEQEPEERGWYSGPIGYFDHHGGGEMVVALRSGVVHGRRVYLFAGAGIVSDSEVDQELEEIRLKVGTLGSALGVFPP